MKLFFMNIKDKYMFKSKTRLIGCICFQVPIKTPEQQPCPPVIIVTPVKANIVIIKANRATCIAN